jgi:hypothetical protein
MITIEDIKKLDLGKHPTVVIHDEIIDPRCKNCRFWKKWENGRDADCLKFYPEPDEMESADYERGDMARASYDDSVISTGPNFGCIHFEVKDDNH